VGTAGKEELKPLWHTTSVGAEHVSEFSVIEAFICVECGEGVNLKGRIQ
jgi:hypothetical protein